jgi:hypothetical protein
MMGDEHLLFNARDWYWRVGGDAEQVYSSARQTYVSVADAAYAAFVAAGLSTTPISDEAALWDVLRRAQVPPYHQVSTYRIVRRLEEAGLIEAAEAALDADRTLWRRFYTVGFINADDADARAFLTAVGTDPDSILAPE